ncbi:dolichyl-phosphate-mannose--protein mannosyltransferase [Nocardia sp. NPDC088792]|uniref:dolichyl-phosphate-mannose--protein mannosyltransferase n=1 Tax=Nocardia sp. NPDC088792 TaxID=3364332 RepID=UPI0037F8579D
MVAPAPLRPRPESQPSDTARGWLVTIALTLLAGILRFARLNYPTDGGTPMFDEKYYADQAWQMLSGGRGIEDNPGYALVVHPPVGKLLITGGEAIFGYTPLGWRFSAAVAGTLLVLLVIRIVRRMARSTLIGAIAGILMLADGVTFVNSRIGLLDIFQTLFVTAAFGCLIVDRDQMRERMARADAAGRTRSHRFGPRLGVRWWRFGAGVLLGLACGTKWSGLYFVIFFLVLSLGFDIAARRAYGVRQPWLGTVVRDLAPAVYALVFISLTIYLASYAGWFADETAVDRYEVGVHVGPGGWFSWVPDALRSLWFYHGAMLDFHVQLTNTNGYHHPWESKPWTWPMGLRPTLYYFPKPAETTGCGQASCVRAVMLVGTPVIWWPAFPLLGWSLWQSVVRRDWRFIAVLTGYAAGWLPWFADLDRQMYFFYATVMAPFLVMALALTLGQVLGRSGQSAERRGIGLLLVSIYLGLAIANFAWLYPILTGVPITPATWNRELWLPSWQ